MKASVPADLLKLKDQFDAWRKTRSKRSKTPEHLQQAAIALLDQCSASMICRVCRLNPQILDRPTQSSSTQIKSIPEFFPLSLTLPDTEQTTPHRQPQADCRVLLERPDGSRLTIVLPGLDPNSISALCQGFWRS
jgi:hypothetical protein